MRSRRRVVGHFLDLILRTVISIFISLCATGYVEAQQTEAKVSKDSTAKEFDIRDGSFLLPLPLPKGKYYHAIGVYYVIVPKDWALDNIQAPFFNYSAKYTLPHGFNLQGSLSTLFISNRINLGPFWNYTVGHYHFGVGYQVVFDYGILNQFGFKTSLTGWEQQPSITAGYSLKKAAIILRGDLYYTNALYLNEGGHTIPSSNGFLNGYSLTGTVEQRLWANRLFSFGLKVNYIKYHIVAWPAFPVNQYRYYVPEFQFGLKF
jgi:hypothetical protein